MASSRKKNEASSDNDILHDLNYNPKNFSCETCNVTFTDAKSKERHVIGKKHLKKLNDDKQKAKEKMKAKENGSEKTESEDSDDESELYCDVCNKYFPAYISYAAHLKGSVHSKKVKAQKLKEKFNDMPEVIKDEKGNTDSDEDESLSKAYARCVICQKEFSGPESLNMHKKSANHLKKVKAAKMVQEMKKNGGENSDGEEIYKSCKICKSAFSGIIPYQIHLNSKVHQKNSDKMRIAEKNREFYDLTDEGYVCKECKKAFTDPLAFDNHLRNNSHEKQKTKKALTEFLNENPSIILVTEDFKSASQDRKKDESSDSESDPMYFLICKICNVSFNGPESTKDHVKSKKHIATVKEKKARKLIKVKKEASSKISVNDDNDNEALKEESSNNKQENDSKYNRKNSTEEFEVI